MKRDRRSYRAHKHIHRTLKKHAPKEVHKAKRLVAFRYPKLFVLFLSIILTYYLFSQAPVSSFMTSIENNYFSIFVAGVFLSFGFLAPFGIGFFLSTQSQNIILPAVIAGFGAMAGDMLIFKTIKNFFIDEFKELERKKIIKKIEKIVEKNKNVLIRHYLLYVFAGIMIATPLPDEMGVSMLAGLTTIKPWRLAVISFILHTLAVLFILYIGFAL